MYIKGYKRQFITLDHTLMCPKMWLHHSFNVAAEGYNLNL